MNTRLMHKSQRGFSLIELVIVIALAGIVAAAITGTIMGVFNMDASTRNYMIAVYQTRQAGKMVSHDVLQTQGVNATGSNGFPLILAWIDWETSESHAVNYTLVNMPSGELKRLQRSESVNGEAPTVQPVAEYIDPDPTKTSCDWDNVNKVLTFTVTATVGEQSKTRICEVKPRPGS